VLALAGAKVALAARRADRLEHACAAIRERGGACLPVALDVTDRDRIVAAVAKTEAELGALSILVNNAGVVVSKPFFEHTEEDWDHVVDTNLKGAWLAARAFAQHLVGKKRGGRIVNIASVLSFRTIARVPSYLAAKAGLLHLNSAMAMELARYNILVNAIAPGYVVTDFNREFLESEAGLKLAARVPMKRVGQVEDLGGALLFLCSPASAYVTGACISVDGGHGVAAI
jgi:NAD(P)-dependent dehydrogenase (short-subunit alcohol dehydrogenase family)